MLAAVVSANTRSYRPSQCTIVTEIANQSNFMRRPLESPCSTRPMPLRLPPGLMIHYGQILATALRRRSHPFHTRALHSLSILVCLHSADDLRLNWEDVDWPTSVEHTFPLDPADGESRPGVSESGDKPNVQHMLNDSEIALLMSGSVVEHFDLHRKWSMSRPHLLYANLMSALWTKKECRGADSDDAYLAKLVNHLRGDVPCHDTGRGAATITVLQFLCLHLYLKAWDSDNLVQRIRSFTRGLSIALSQDLVQDTDPKPLLLLISTISGEMTLRHSVYLLWPDSYRYDIYLSQHILVRTSIPIFFLKIA